MHIKEVRASNLQELVYKQAQAGITKATVSVVFDNSDRSRSPLGYEDYSKITVTRQIVVGGRSKYLINGHLAQPSRVQNLFHSEQLNVNNPHFLIMQGRITKVLNMKPPEILSMLEEAAGTRMYETKKDAALKTLEKKQGKVDEINKLLDQEILPALEKLRKERVQYMQWSNGNAELDRLKRFCIAYEYVQAEKIRDNVVLGIDEIKTKISEIDNDIETMNTEVQEMDAHVEKLTVEKDATMGKEVKGLSDKVDAISRDLVKETSVLKNLQDDLTTETKNAEKIGKNIEELKQSEKDRISAVKIAEDGAADLKKRVDELAKSLEDLEKEQQGVVAGKNSGNEEKCLEDQLGDAKVAVGKKQLEIRQKDVENVEKALKALSYEEGQMESLEKDRMVESEAVHRIKEEIRNISSRLGNIEFSYRDPVKNFDRSKVKGVVAKLIKVKNRSTMTALEVCAGGKLYNVVLDTENTGKQLLQNGKGNAEVALSLVDYDDELQLLIYASSVQLLAVICYYLWGGGDLLRQLHALAEAESELTLHQKRLSEIEAKVNLQSYLPMSKVSKLLPLHKKYNDLKIQLALKSNELSLFQSRVEQNEHHKLSEVVKKIEQELAEAKSAVSEKEALYKERVTEVATLEKSIHDHANNRERILKDLEKKIKTVKTKMQCFKRS
ncbi:hypothetical protein L1987_15581 [Smallanthus sonchifolius]|uniref:Uncharacterized protein n=1 Tax=Smallanthus sonchifolius TaxID=185202 RepID=A0ACB9J892_9ASTR|nr:hypothetical protein L1987_15581 [Smallanthus sonchifolius]